MRLTTPNVLALWRRDPALEGSLAHIRAELGAKKEQTDALRRILDRLVEQGVLEVRRRNYRLVQAPLKGRRRPEHKEQALPVGVFSAHPNGFGFVELEGARDSVFIPPPYISGAMDGDWVRVEQVHPRGKRSYGKVVEVLRRKRSRIRGQLYREHGGTWVAPYNEKIPMVFIEEEKARDDLPAGTAVEVELVHFPEYHDEAPEGRILQVLGDQEKPEQVVLNILADTTLSPDFSPATLDEMRAMPREVRARPKSGREDLRDRLFVTIDGKDARDFDDAVCLEALDNGHVRLLVSIADVAHYVRPGMAVDLDAYQKGTSVYFPNQVFHMLPEFLSANLCSLKPRVPRLSVTCEMELDPAGERRAYRIYESVIESKARLTYGQVLQYFESGRRAGLATGVTDMLDRMRGLAATLRTKRSRRGALDFSFPEYRFDLDRNGYPRRILEVWANEATRLIEQFMLEANETVAWHCAANDVPILYRVHDPPPEDLLPNLAVNLWNFGVEVKESALRKPDGIKRLLEETREHRNREQIELAILKSMSQAQYRDRNDGHFALAATHYTHFTSPIRRYPDLLVHRGLKAALGEKGRPLPLPPHAGLHLSTAERNAADAQQKVVRLYKVLFMEPRLGESFPARVTGLGERGLVVNLRDIPVDGFLPAELLPGRNYKLDRKRNALVARGRSAIAIGDKLTVVLARTDRLTQQIEFSLADWGWADDEPAANPPRSGRSAR